MATAKKDIRSLTLGAKKVFREKEIEYEGVTVKFKQVTRRKRSELLSRCRDESGNLDSEKFAVMAIIYTCCDEDGEYQFSVDDFETIMELPAEASDFVSVFAEHAIKVLGLTADEDAAKN